MKISPSAAALGRVFGRTPGALPVVHGLALSTMVGLAAFAPAANAVPVLSAVSNVVVPATTAGLYINVVTGVFGTTPSASPGWDLNPWGSGSLFVYGPTSGTIVTSTNSAVAGLLSGAVVGSGSTFASNSGGAATFGSLAGQWTLNATNYFGFKFTGEDTLTHYGYGSMIVGATPLIRTIGQIWYESAAATSITVGGTVVTPVPEPSSVALMLAGGGLVALAMRRRRQAGR